MIMMMMMMMIMMMMFSDTLVGSDLVRPTLMGQGLMGQTNGLENTQVSLLFFQVLTNYVSYNHAFCDAIGF